MNKIFKIVFNAARGKMMVVNEATSSVQTGKKAAVTVAVIGALVSGSALAATYEYSFGNTSPTIKNENGVVYANDDVIDTTKDVTLQTFNYLNFADGAKLVIDGDFISCANTKLHTFQTGNEIRAKNIELAAIRHDLFSGNGGIISATENLKIGLTIMNGVTLQAGETLTFGGSPEISGASVITAKDILLGGTATLRDTTKFVDVQKVTFEKSSSRIENWTNGTIEFGELEVNGTGEAKLVNKSTADGFAFDIGKVAVKDGAQLAVYTDNQRPSGQPEVVANALGAKIGEVVLGANSEMHLGWRGSDYLDSGLSEIGKVVLNEGSLLSVKDGANPENGTPTVQEDADVVIAQIEVVGNNAKVGANLTGDETNITVADGVTGASIAKISTKKANINVATPGTDGQLSIGAVGADSTVEVTTSAENNTGNAEADLGKLAAAVGIDAQGNEGTVNFGIGETDVFGAATATLGENGLEGITQLVNSKTEALAEKVTLAPQMLTRIMMNDVRKRMGDLRAAEGTHGVWARYNGGEMSGQGADADFHMVQVGIDTVPEVGAPRFGVAFSYAQSEAKDGVGTADMDAYSLAFYGTKMYDNGMFVDVIGRMATMDTDLVNGGYKGKMDNVALSLSGEYGWRFDVTDSFYVEPSAELTYTYTNADKFEMTNGGTYELESTDSLVGRLGVAAGFKCPQNFGDVYVRAAVVHEFMGDATMRSWMNGTEATPFEADGKDTWAEFGLGAQFNVNKNTYVFADVEFTDGAAMDEDWRANVGVRFAF